MDFQNFLVFLIIKFDINIFIEFSRFDIFMTQKQNPNASKLSFLWSHSLNLPFIETESFQNVSKFIHSWSNIKPFLILYGNISSGKSRLIKSVSSKFLLNLVEIDCHLIQSSKKQSQSSKNLLSRIR